MVPVLVAAFLAGVGTVEALGLAGATFLMITVRSGARRSVRRRIWAKAKERESNAR